MILNGLYVTYNEIDGRIVIKTKREWDVKEKKLIQVNYKGYNTLLYTLGSSKFNKVSMCEKTKQIWDTLETIYEGLNQVKKFKIGLLTLDYELFRMKEGESIN